MEGDALDHAGDLLGRGLALWDSGMHTWEFILPRRAAYGDSRGFGCWKRFLGAAGFCGQAKIHLRETWRPGVETQ